MSSFGQSITHRYMSLGGNVPHVHLKMLAAKGALIHSSIPHGLKMKMVHGYRSAEKSIFGHTTTLPGEGELGVGGLGTTIGQRIQLRKEAIKADNPAVEPSSGSSDIGQAILSHFSGSTVQ